MEVVGLNRARYSNRDALSAAMDIYRTAMRSFIIWHLKQIHGERVEDVVIDSLPHNRGDEIDRRLYQSNRNIKDVIDINDFPHLVNRNWEEVFERILNDDKTFRNQLWLIVECRNSEVAHPPEGDAESESTRAHLFFIADVLSKINDSDAKDKVEVIRDELDDTAERLADAEERLEEMKAENAEYQKSLTEAEKHLETAKSEKSKYEEAKSKELKVTKEEARTFEENLKATSNQLKEALDEWMASMESLTATRNLFTAATIGSQEIQKIFPSFETDSAVRILDRRGTDKRTYLLALLEQKQPTIIYVQSEEKIDQLRDLVGSEKAAMIEKHSEQTSETEETEILERLGKGELVAIVSDTTFSTLTQSHRVEHFVFCHLAPSSDAFFDRCQPAFTSANNAYLHFIYESKQNVEDLAEKYPNEETLRQLYQKFRDRTPINTEFINPDNLYNQLCKENELDITNLGIETGFSIFEELGFLEKNEEGIRRLSTPPRKLEESKIYCRGKKLKEEIANSPAFQHEHSIKQIWEKMLEELNIDSEQTLRESGIHSKHFKILEKDSDMQLTTETEQDKITPPPPDVWPQRSLSPFDALRQRAAKSLNDASLTQFREDGGGKNSPYSPYEVESTLLEDEEDYENRYNLAMEFAQEYGISALEQGIAQLIKDQNDADYDFTEDETNMLHAFQEVLRNFQTQTEQSTEDDETVRASPPPKFTRANAKVTEEQVPLREIRREVPKSTQPQSRKKKLSIAERYVAETTVEERDGIAAKVVELRINATGSKPLAWREIREKLGLHNDQFHKVIRHSEGYRKAVIQRIKSLKAQEGGWEYNGKLEVLTGIELTEKELE